MTHKPWLQYYEPGAKAWQPRYDDALSAFRAAVRSGRGGISYFGRRWSFADIDVASDRLCAWAHAQGVDPGARISIILQNVPAFPIVLVAAWKLGAIPVPGNSAYRALELGRLFADYRPSLVVCHPEHEPEVRQALDAVSVTAPILVVSSVEHGEHPDSRVVPANDAVASHHRRLSEILDAESPAAAPPARTHCEPSDLGLLLYTSGTSGEPKGTMLRHSSLINNAEMMADWGGLHGDSRILGAAPSFHITGVVCQVLISIVRRRTRPSGAAALPKGTSGRRDPQLLWHDGNQLRDALHAAELVRTRGQRLRRALDWHPAVELGCQDRR